MVDISDVRSASSGNAADMVTCDVRKKMQVLPVDVLGRLQAGSHYEVVQHKSEVDAIFMAVRQAAAHALLHDIAVL